MKWLINFFVNLNNPEIAKSLAVYQSKEYTELNDLYNRYVAAHKNYVELTTQHVNDLIVQNNELKRRLKDG